ncbi:glycoside hydrolase family 127 protein [Anaerocellum danielii]|uniref:Glycoside hydrolase family 127 protein n=1 Tax=Anaerocellum danielii TaxID=1387557 RepID=A0ABZ0TZH6_9FIRM|nr:beta-L-arabinofuranosidase domain-containing protein [Caldicellulosiruptor danielii]WPX08461.1 glycoside hydrolase family 127 protein [Caldicellulosiruptor danielii]
MTENPFTNYLKSPEIKNVTIKDPFWGRYIDLVRDVVVPYQWKILNDLVDIPVKSHAIKNFKIATGLENGEFEGFVFQDSDVAKWLEAASYVLEKYPNPDLEKKVDEVIDIIEKAQWEDGYLNTYFTIKEKGKRWTNLEECHELYTAGHMIEAGVAHFKATGKTKLLDIVCRLADHIYSVFGKEEGKIRGYDGHPEIELALVKLYEVTNNSKYLELAKFFIDERGQEPYYFDIEWEKRGKKEHWKGFKGLGREYLQAHKPVREQREAVGHAVRAVYLYSGMADVAYYTKDKELYDVCEVLFEDIRNRKMYITGAIGSSAHGEAFTFEYDLPNAAAYAETCASVGLVFFAHRMNRIKPHRKYYDVIERALYNTIIGSISQDGKKYFYVNPLEVFPKEAEKRFDRHHVKPERQPWFGCACCPPNVARLLASLGRHVYSYNHDGIYVNLYIGSSVQVEVGGVKVLLQQVSSYPFEDMVKIDLKPSKEARFKLCLRIPSWCENYEVLVNGKKEEMQKLPSGYVCIEKLWGKNDQVILKIPTEVKIVSSHPQIRSNVGKVAVVKGPVVFCAEEADNGKNLHLLFVDVNSKCKLEFDSNILEGLYTVEIDGFRMAEDDFGQELYKSHKPKFVPAKIKLIPYYAWANRGANEMRVWLFGK